MGSALVEGLVDSCSDPDFKSNLEAPAQSWRNCDITSTANLGKIDYFVIKKAPLIRNTMLHPVREECGLGCPLKYFTTNASGSVNAMAEAQIDYKRNELPKFIGKVREFLHEQEQEAEQAVLCRENTTLESSINTWLVNIPPGCLEGIWAKASMLISDSRVISSAPGQDKAARMVLSYSGKFRHMVTPTKGGGFSYDSSCPNWKALSVCLQCCCRRSK